MSCNISIEKYIFSVEKVSRLGIKKFIHYVFVGDVSPDIEKVLKKLENRQNLKQKDVDILQTNYKKYYTSWINVVKKNIKIVFVKCKIQMDDTIEEIKKKIYIYLSDVENKKYIIPENQELWIQKDKDYYILGSYYENIDNNERINKLPSIYEKYQLDALLLGINKKNNKLKINTIYNNTVLIDIMNDFDIHTHVLYLNDAKDEEDSLKTKGIIINTEVIDGYFKKFWPFVNLSSKYDEEKSKYLLMKRYYQKENYILSLIDNTTLNKSVFDSYNIITIQLNVNNENYKYLDENNSFNGSDDDFDYIDLYQIFEYLREKKIGLDTPFIKYGDPLFKSPFTLISKDAIESKELKKQTLKNWLHLNREELRKVNGLIIKRKYKSFPNEPGYSSIFLNKSGKIAIHTAFLREYKATFCDVVESIKNCKKLVEDINKNRLTTRFDEKKKINVPDIDFVDRRIELKYNTKIIYMNIEINYLNKNKDKNGNKDRSIDFNKLLEFSKNFPNFLSELPKEYFKKNKNGKGDGFGNGAGIIVKNSLKLKYNRVSGFANMNEIMTSIDILKQENVKDFLIVKIIEKKYQKSAEDAKSYLLEWKKKYSSLKNMKIDPRFKKGILVTITNDNIKLDGITKVYQIPLIYNFMTTFMTLFLNYDEFIKQKNFKKMFLTNSGININYFKEKSLNKQNMNYEEEMEEYNNIDLNLKNSNFDEILLNQNILKLDDSYKKESSLSSEGSNSEIDSYHKVKGLATDDQIVPEARLSCEDKIIEKDTCVDLCNDGKYFLRRLQRYDNKLFRYNVSKVDEKKQYSRKCQRRIQPVILPYDPETDKSINRESFTYSIKYGSFTDPDESRWYICPKIWCPICEIPILESEIDESTIKVKLIEDKSGICKTAKCPRGNHQVFIRESGNYFPGFQEHGNHPKGYCMPCCFVKNQLDPKYKAYKIYKKCIGDEVENINIKNQQIYILGKSIPLDKGRYGKLSPEMGILLNTDLDTGYLGNRSGYLRKGIKQEYNNSFLSAVANILSCSIDEQPIDIIGLKKALLEKLDEKMFLTLYGGNLEIVFNDRTKNIRPINNFKNYIMNPEIFVDHKYLWDYLQRPGILFDDDDGINIFIFENNNLLCPMGENVEYFYNDKRDSILLIKHKNFYEPIYYLEGDAKSAKIKCKFSSSSRKEIQKIIEISKEGCGSSVDTVINWEEVLKRNIQKYDLKIQNPSVVSMGPDLQTVLNELLPAIKNKKLGDGFIPKVQYVDSYNKVYALVLTNGLFFPISPTKININMDIKNVYDYNNIKRLDFDKTVKYLNEINNKTGLKCGVTNKILDLSSGKNIIAVATELNKIIPVISIKNNDNKLKISNLHYYTDSNVAIKDDIIMIDKRIEQINKKKFEDETYQRMRFELSRYLQLNKIYISKITEIIERPDKDINKMRKLMYTLLNEIFMELISFKSSNINYDYYQTPNNRVPCFTRKMEDKKRDKDKKKEMKSGNEIKFSCNDDPHCVIDKDECKLFVNRKNLLNMHTNIDNYDFYLYMIIDELLRYRLKRLEILNDNIPSVIDKELIVDNPNKYIIIHNMNQDDVYHIFEKIYEDTKGFNLDTRKLFEETTTKEYSFQKDKYLKIDTKVLSNTLLEDLSIYWEKFLGNKFKVKLNDGKKRSLFISLAFILNLEKSRDNEKTSTFMIKKRISEFVLKYSSNKDLFEKILDVGNYKSILNKNSDESSIVQLYKYESENDFKLVGSNSGLVNELLSDGYEGCLLDIFYFSIIYNFNVIIIDKRIKKDTDGFFIIGPQFGLYEKYILLYKSISLEKNNFIYNLIEYKNKFIFSKKELPQKFLKLLDL
jgi:hypothetical protein